MLCNVQKGTKTALETTRTFATLFADMEIRQRLVMAQSVEQFRSTLLSAAKELAMDQNQWRERKSSIHLSHAKEQIVSWFILIRCWKRSSSSVLMPGIHSEGLRKSSNAGWQSTHQTILMASEATKRFRSCSRQWSSSILPAFYRQLHSEFLTMITRKGRLVSPGFHQNSQSEHSDVRKVIIAQAIGGIFFSLFGGQPMIILLTTVPLAIYIKGTIWFFFFIKCLDVSVIFKISQELGYDFLAMYACVGLFCQLFLILYSATELCSLMKFATRSAEEMFSLFIAIAFTVESIRAIHNSEWKEFVKPLNGRFQASKRTTTIVTLLRYRWKQHGRRWTHSGTGRRTRTASWATSQVAWVWETRRVSAEETPPFSTCFWCLEPFGSACFCTTSERHRTWRGPDANGLPTTHFPHQFWSCRLLDLMLSLISRVSATIISLTQFVLCFRRQIQPAFRVPAHPDGRRVFASSFRLLRVSSARFLPFISVFHRPEYHIGNCQ